MIFGWATHLIRKRGFNTKRDIKSVGVSVCESVSVFVWVVCVCVNVSVCGGVSVCVGVCLCVGVSV